MDINALYANLVGLHVETCWHLPVLMQLFASGANDLVSLSRLQHWKDMKTKSRLPSGQYLAHFLLHVHVTSQCGFGKVSMKQSNANVFSAPSF